MPDHLLPRALPASWFRPPEAARERSSRPLTGAGRTSSPRPLLACRGERSRARARHAARLRAVPSRQVPEPAPRAGDFYGPPDVRGRRQQTSGNGLGLRHIRASPLAVKALVDWDACRGLAPPRPAGRCRSAGPPGTVPAAASPPLARSRPRRHHAAADPAHPPPDRAARADGDEALRPPVQRQDKVGVRPDPPASGGVAAHHAPAPAFRRHRPRAAARAGHALGAAEAAWCSPTRGADANLRASRIPVLAGNLRRFLGGERLDNVVDKEEEAASRRCPIDRDTWPAGRGTVRGGCPRSGAYRARGLSRVSSTRGVPGPVPGRRSLLRGIRDRLISLLEAESDASLHARATGTAAVDRSRRANAGSKKRQHLDRTPQPEVRAKGFGGERGPVQTGPPYARGRHATDGEPDPRGCRLSARVPSGRAGTPDADIDS